MLRKLIPKTICYSGVIGFFIFSFLPNALAETVQTIVIKDLKLDKPMPVKSQDGVKFIVSLQNPSSLDSAKFSVQLAVSPNSDGTSIIFRLNEPYAPLKARDIINIKLKTTFTIPEDLKDMYVWVGIGKFPGEEWPKNQQADQKGYYLLGETSGYTSIRTFYKYNRILPYTPDPKIDLRKILDVSAK
jgi:hypothetical protein